MTNAAVRYGAVAALLAISTACSESSPPTRPSPVAASVETPAPPPPVPHTPTFPALSRPGRVYVGVPAPATPTHGSALYSRFVLYDDGTFALQYSSANFGFFDYRGTYTGETALEFQWEGWSTAGPWGASGTLDGETLSVKYNLIMQLTDFEDGVYTRER